jgi:hypothetical protein
MRSHGVWVVLCVAACKPVVSTKPALNEPDAVATTTTRADAATPVDCAGQKPAVGDRWVYKLRVDVPLPNEAFQPEPLKDQVLTLRSVAGDRVTGVDVRWGDDQVRRGCDVSACGVAFQAAPFGASVHDRIGRVLLDLVAQPNLPRIDVKHVGHDEAPEPNEVFDVSIGATEAQAGAGQLWFYDYKLRGRVHLRSADGLLLAATFSGNAALWRRHRDEAHPPLPADETADFSGSITRDCAR